MSRAPEVAPAMMGVSGSGKTTVGERLARRLRWSFKEGDGLHPPADVAKLKVGRPLTDDDRAPWPAAVASWIDAWRGAAVPGVITCSALKRVYRQALAQGRPELHFIYPRGDPMLVPQRIAGRRGHFTPPALLASQFDDPEPPSPEEEVMVIEVDQRFEAHIEALVGALQEQRLGLAQPWWGGSGPLRGTL